MLESCAAVRKQIMYVPESEWLRMAKQGDETALHILLCTYEPLVHRKAGSYFLIGGEREDLIQEGLIGLYEAICQFDETRHDSFQYFATLCVTRHMYTAIRRATRKKHAPLNDSLSLDYPYLNEEGNIQWIQELVEGSLESDPIDWVIQKERIERLLLYVKQTFSPLEREVFTYHLQGDTYRQIARKLKRDPKSIDNAIQRIRRKVSEKVQGEASQTIH